MKCRLTANHGGNSDKHFTFQITFHIRHFIFWISQIKRLKNWQLCKPNYFKFKLELLIFSNRKGFILFFIKCHSKWKRAKMQWSMAFLNVYENIRDYGHEVNKKSLKCFSIKLSVQLEGKIWWTKQIYYFAPFNPWSLDLDVEEENNHF